MIVRIKLFPRWQCEQEHQLKVVDAECNRRSRKTKGSRVIKEKKKKKCRKYFRTFVEEGKDMKTVFENLKKKPTKRRCKGRRCRKPTESQETTTEQYTTTFYEVNKHFYTFGALGRML